MIREVERHRHVGLPHTALHVVHGKGVLGVLGERHLVVFVALIAERPGCGAIVRVILVKGYSL